MGRGRNSRSSGVGEAALRAAVGGTPGARESRATVVGKVVDAYRSSNNNLRTLLQNLVDVGVVDVFGGAEDDDLRALVDVDLPGWDPDLSVMWKLLAIAAFSFTGVPVLLGCLVDAASARVQAWMPLVYSLASFVLGTCWSWMRR